MALLSALNSAFSCCRHSFRLQSAFQQWRVDDASLARFANVEELIDFCRTPKPSLYDEKNRIFAVLCHEARQGSSEAALLLTWLFKGPLWKIIRAIGESVLDPEELDAEILAGFWEVAGDASESRRLSGRLIEGARRRAWRVVARARRDASPLADVEVDIPDPSPFVENPSIVVERALAEGVVSETGAELILATRLEGLSLRRVAETLDLDSEDSARKRRQRAEIKLVGWLTEDSPMSRDISPRPVGSQSRKTP